MLYSEESEISVLGALMLEDVAFDRVTETGLQASDFYAHKHRLTFEAICHLAESGKPVDVVTVADRLKLKEQLQDAGGAAYLSQMVDLTPSIDNCEAYAEQIVDCARRRMMQAMCSNASDMIRSGSDTLEIQNYVSTELQGVEDRGSTNSIIAGKDALHAALKGLDDRFNFEGSDWLFGIDQLDGLVIPEPSRVIGILGATSSGKSTLAQTASETSLKMGIPVLYMTMEMPAPQLMNRYISSVGEVDRNFLKDPRGFRNPDEQWGKLAAATNIIKEWPLDIDDTARQTIATVTARAKSWVRKMKADGHGDRMLLIVDHVHLMSIEGKDIVNELGAISKGLKHLALETGLCILPLLQANRALANRPDRRPQKHDIRDSGKIEADLDAVIGVYRDVVYNPDTEMKGTAEAIISKNRDGELGTAYMRDDLRFSRFTSLNTPFQSQN